MDEYQFPGFCPVAKIKGKFGDSNAWIISLERRQKKRNVASAEPVISIITTVKNAWFEICPVVRSEYIWRSIYAVSTVINVAR